MLHSVWANKKSSYLETLQVSSSFFSNTQLLKIWLWLVWGLPANALQGHCHYIVSTIYLIKCFLYYKYVWIITVLIVWCNISPKSSNCCCFFHYCLVVYNLRSALVTHVKDTSSHMAVIAIFSDSGELVLYIYEGRSLRKMDIFETK